MRLVVVHHHFRPGGVRRVIELALPAVAHARRAVREVVLAGDAAPEPRWLEPLRARLAPLPVRLEIEPALGYRAETRLAKAEVRRRLRAWLERIVGSDPGASTGAGEVVAWVHNPGLGRNLILVEELARALRAGRLRCVWHHHDWWFDNRWQRWPELLRDAGSVDAVARALFPADRRGVHVGINRPDVAGLRRGWGTRVGWWPNPVRRERGPSEAAVRAARRWVADRVGDEAARRYWLLPCRFLRRKNIPEAMLLVRWLRPEAWLVTTAAPSSADEQPMFERLGRAIAERGWRVALGVLDGAPATAPGVADLLGGCEAVVFTSLLEGFGLPYLEAATAGRPLVGRALPRVLPDLEHFGFRFPTLYDELRVAPGLFDWEAEVERQRRLFAVWRAGLPRRFRGDAGEPCLAGRATPGPVPFDRLTFTAQLEVLGRPTEESWRSCLPLNPFLGAWRTAARTDGLPPLACPEAAFRRLESGAYARRFWRTLDCAGRAPGPAADVSRRVQEALVRERLSAAHLFPVLWAPQT